MKKTILATLAIASMMSCSNEELLEAPAQQAITFGNTFVEKAPATRAAYDGSYTTNSLAQFQVYGIITNKDEESGRVFTGQKVNKNTDGTWTLDGATQYWIPGNTYHFWGIADGNVEGATSVDAPEAFKHVPQTITVDASLQKDVLLATRTFEDYQTTHGTVVEFTFRHLMAKAKFTVKNTVSTDNGYNYVVSGIQITTDKNGIYDVASGKWSRATTPATYTLPFGNAVEKGILPTEEMPEGAVPVAIGFNSKAESNFERLLIPNEYKADGSKKLTVTFTCVTRIGTAVLRTETKEVTTQKDVVLEKGKAYNFIISLGNPGEKIQFTVEKINDWETNHEGYNTGVEIK